MFSDRRGFLKALAAGAAGACVLAEPYRSLAETLRTLVAVGTPRLWVMLVTIRAAAPRSGVACASTLTWDFTGAGVATATVGTVERW